MTDKRRKLLILQPSLIVLPSLAEQFHLNEAIVLSQIHYWLWQNKEKKRFNTHFFDNRWWCYNSYTNWQAKNFPWVTVKTLQRIFNGLRALNIIETRPHENDKKGLWVTINYEKLKSEIENYQGQNVQGKAVYDRQNVLGSGDTETTLDKKTTYSPNKLVNRYVFQSLYEDPFEDTEDSVTEEVWNKNMNERVDSALVQYVFEIFGITGKKELGPYVCKLLTSEQDKPGSNEKYPTPISLFNTDKNFKSFVKLRAQLMKGLPKPDVENCLINICRLSRKPKNDKALSRFPPFHIWVQAHTATIQAKEMPTVVVMGPDADDEDDWFWQHPTKVE